MATSHRRPLTAWVVTALLAAGCAAAGAWAVPAWQEAQDLKEASVAPDITASPVAITEASAGNALDSAALSAELDSVLDGLGQGVVSAQVLDADTGQSLYTREAQTSRTPASNMKLLVDYALLTTAPQTRFTTSVDLNDDATLTLVAGGDTLLVPGHSDPTAVMGHAGVETLAERTIAALTEQGMSNKALTLNLDTTIFSGNSLNPEWAQEDIDSGFISAVTPLAFFSHYSPNSEGTAASGSRPSDAPAEVQQVLVEALNRLGADAGLTFIAGEQVSTPSSGREIAAVQSATAAQQSALMMQETDNSLAETLGRNLSVATGGDGSTQGAISAIHDALASAGLPTNYTQMDLSGLSMNNKVSNELLTSIALRAVKGNTSERLALQGLPVAGYSGTLGLATRFNDADEVGGRGVVRAKTGTLNSVLSLTGYTVTESGRVLVFSVIMNELEDTEAAKNTIDRFAAALSNR
ncbi:D-alanyl-D-alanine carboxypeptidase/D-alanyl-D-alanine endopeptidase [Rothia nasimurium]|uniref:D-alanyl-D-alanine carboxypeptidase/D-alanyl-D-alanine endopeptidase n=1 Tax=Rothia nasimurium TaxID=85336 RepID=UPI001F02E7BC|nr:D-alanyl-D-alanine carboxypeptidase/D-alanyl-D-alanine-endopeptidase [Rothia nasimurium]